MLGRNVADLLRRSGPHALVAPEVVDICRSADLFVLNLECCISERGAPWPDPRKPFFFRAPPAAVETLLHLGVDCVTLANNHALDFGEEALVDTTAYLRAAGILSIGAGGDEEEARRPALLESPGFRLAVIAFADHPPDYAAAAGRAGIAFADLRGGRVPAWVSSAVGTAEADAVLVSPHWGPNMRAEPVRAVRAAAGRLVGAGASLVAGHSAHVFHGVAGRVLYDLGDFLDDYAVDAAVRNDLGLLFLVELDERGLVALEAVPLKLGFCFTSLAEGEDAAWIRRRFRAACAALGTDVAEEDGRLTIAWR
jgi:poly-gamma-glutamate capsule biosynthesis protein CapA/YwtB (metallophosphatase superfamily)